MAEKGNSKKRGKHDAGRRSGNSSSTGERVKKTLAKIFAPRNIKIAIAVLGCLAIAVIVFLHMNMDHEHISDEGYMHDEKFSDMLVVDGIDVSYAQGSDIDWKKVKNSGIDFVFIRGGYRGATEGKLNKDDEFEKNIEGATDAGLMVGVYFYSQALNKKEAIEEAEYLVKLVEPYRITMPLVMDYEFFPDGRLANAYYDEKFDQKQGNKNVIEFCKVVEEAGYESMVYGNYSFLEDNLKIGDLDDRTNIWLAHFEDQTDFSHDYIIWQCSDEASVPGIYSAVDKDFWYLDTDGVYETTSQIAEHRISIKNCSIELDDHSSRYIGWNVEPGVTVKYGDRILTEGKDYYASYIKNTSPGTGYVIVQGIGKYKDAVAQSFLIKGVFE